MVLRHVLRDVQWQELRLIFPKVHQLRVSSEEVLDLNGPKAISFGAQRRIGTTGAVRAVGVLPAEPRVAVVDFGL